MNKVKFAIFTHLHYEHIPDGYERIIVNDNGGYIIDII